MQVEWMLNYIWLTLVLMAVLLGGFTGHLQEVTTAAFDACKNAVMTIALPLAGVMALWLGLMKIAERFGFPVITLIDTPGAYCGLEAEERGQGEAIARNIFEMIRLKVPVICVIIGEGASGGALGIGVGDH